MAVHAKRSTGIPQPSVYVIYYQLLNNKPLRASLESATQVRPRRRRKNMTPSRKLAAPNELVAAPDKAPHPLKRGHVGQELLSVGILRVVQHVVNEAVFDDLAVAQDRHPGGDVPGQRDVVRDEEHR